MVFGDRLMRILAEEALCRLPNVQNGAVETPCGTSRGLIDKWKLDICLVSVVRSGKDSLSNFDFLIQDFILFKAYFCLSFCLFYSYL